MSQYYTIKEHIIEASHIREFARATADSQDAVLELHVKQYVPKDNQSPRKGDITIIGAHANGFPKEMYEPFYDDFYKAAKKNGIRIRGIWIVDAAWQGQSGRLNLESGLLGNEPGWFDYSRDIIHMINTFRMPRPLVAIGHSLGACALSYAAITHPRLFHSIVLFDPVILPNPLVQNVNRTLDPTFPARASTARRDVWPSREAAATSFKKNKFYQAWDSRVFDQWVQYGLRCTTEDPNGEVTLSTTKHQEVFTFVRPSWPAFDDKGENVIRPELIPDCGTSIKAELILFPFYRGEPISTYMRLNVMRPGAIFILGGKSNIVDAQGAAARTAYTGSGIGGSGGQDAGRVKQVTHSDYGHLIPMEDPAFCARTAAEFLKGELDIWATEEKEYEAWTKRSIQDKSTLTEEWTKWYSQKPTSKI